MGIEQWSTTPASNVNANTGINWDEGQAPSTVNNSARDTMAAVREWYEDAEWIKLGENGSATAYSISYVSATVFKFASTDRRTLAPIGRRVKAGVGAGVIYGRITDSSLSASDTQITVSWDSGNLDASLSFVSLGILSPSNSSVPNITGNPDASLSDVAITGAMSFASGATITGNPDVSLSDVSVTGNTTLGDAAGDSLTINAGTWTIGSNYTATRAAGALAAGTTNIRSIVTTSSADSGGTTNKRSVTFTDTLTGGNSYLAATNIFSSVDHGGTSTVTALNSINSFINLSSSGNITTAINYTASGAGFASSGVITNSYGFKVSSQVGHATAVTNAVGFYSDDIIGSITLTAGFRGQVSSGTGKYNLYMDGTAQNYLAGVTGIGNTPSSTTQLILPAGTTGVSSLRIPHGSAPTSPVDGDIWTTSSGLYVRINGVTVGPLS